MKFNKYLIPYLILVALIAFELTQIVGLQDQQTRIQNQQIQSRIDNVQLWCNGINQGRDQDRAILGSRYTLQDMNCSAIIQRTVKSGR